MGSTTRALARTVATGLIVGMGLLGGAASAQTGEVVITEPEDQSAVTQGETVTVRGTGCEPGSEVVFSTSSDGTLGQTTAADDGSFEGELTAPVWGVADDDALEPYELGVTVTCGDATGGFVILNLPAEGADDGDDGDDSAGGVVITEPEDQTAVTQGDTVTVRGTGCEPGSEVVFTSDGETLGQTTAADDGSFEGEMTTPVWGVADDDALEPYELGVTVTCGDATGGFVILNLPAEGADDDGAGGPTEEQLAYTGTETDLAVAGVAALLGGALLLAGSSRARRRAGADGASRA